MSADITQERWQQIKALFAAVLEVPAYARPDFIKLEARGDSMLVAEVESLLASHAETGGLLDSMPTDLRAKAFAADDSSRVGERIGAYRIVDVLGTGGMGQVFKAVRDDDQYRSEVAIKLMRADVSDTLAEQRFRTERQILAGLDHRNIARLIDGGTTVSGSPYVVMELVSGEPIDKFAEAHGLKVRARVQLFLQVCAAASYAHQHLVIHRDLKPNNILVTADGSVKLLDFGIAKLLDDDSDIIAVRDETVTQLRAMTLDYASPEQVSGGTVTTVSDVYSLGVVLYRLLTGQSPYGPHVNDAKRLKDILSDTAPTRPSQAQTANRPRTREIDADLDNILLMALRKEPQRRYGSVEQFASDLRNYLAGLPVKARGNALGYRTGKFLRRRKIEIAAAVVVVASLAGGLWISIREGREAERQRIVAQRHFDGVRKLANTMLFQLHDEMARDASSLKSRELLVRTSLEYLDALYQQGGSDLQLQEELANAYIKVASIQGSDSGTNRGNFAGALDSYARSIALLAPLTAADPENHRAGWALAHAYVGQAALQMVVSGPKSAQESAMKGVALTEVLAPRIADEAQRLARLVSAYATQADIQGFAGLSLEAMETLGKLISVSEAYWRAHPDDEQALLALSTAYNSAALIDDPRLTGAAAIEERAFALFRKSMWADERLLALKPDETEYQVRLSTSRFNTGLQLAQGGKFEQALGLFEQALPVAAAVAARDPDDVRAQYSLALYRTRFAQALFRTGSVEEARAQFLESGRTLEAVFKQDNSLRTQYAIGVNSVRLGELYAYLAEDSRADRSAKLELWREAHESLKRGVTSLQTVTAQATLSSSDMREVSQGIASLARVEAAIAGLQQRN